MNEIEIQEKKTALSFILELHGQCRFAGNEKPGVATNSEIRRWLQDHAVIINGVKPGPFDEITYPVQSVVLFPKGKRRCTIQ